MPASKGMISAWRTEKSALAGQIKLKKGEISEMKAKKTDAGKIQKAAQELQDLVKQSDALARKIENAEE